MDIDQPSTLRARSETEAGTASSGTVIQSLAPAKSCCCGCTLRSGIQLASLFELITGSVQVFVYLRYLGQGAVTNSRASPPPPPGGGSPSETAENWPVWLAVVALFVSAYTCVVGGYGLRATNTYLATHQPERLTNAAKNYCHIVTGKLILYVTTAVLQNEFDKQSAGASTATLILFSLWYAYLWYIAWSYWKWLLECESLPLSVRNALQRSELIQAAPPAQEMARLNDSNTAFGIPCDNEGLGGGWSNTPYDGSGGVLVVRLGTPPSDHRADGAETTATTATTSSSSSGEQAGADAQRRDGDGGEVSVDVDGEPEPPPPSFDPFVQPAASWRGVPVGMPVEWRDPPDVIGQPYTSWPPDAAEARPRDDEVVLGCPRFPPTSIASGGASSEQPEAQRVPQVRRVQSRRSGVGFDPDRLVGRPFAI